MPQQQPPPDSVRTLVEDNARRCLAALTHSGEQPRPDAAIQHQGGWTVLVAAFPSPATSAGARDLSDADRDCLALLAQVDEPLSAARVRAQLEERGMAIWAEITVKRALARLHRLKLVAHHRSRPRGYFLPDRLPLFLQQSA